MISFGQDIQLVDLELFDAAFPVAPGTEDDVRRRFMTLFAEFGELKSGSPDSPEAQAQVRKLQSFITENMYTCTDDILRGLGKMYAGGGDFTKNIDSYGGKGTAEFASQAIEIYCR